MLLNFSAALTEVGPALQIKSLWSLDKVCVTKCWSAMNFITKKDIFKILGNSCERKLQNDKKSPQSQNFCIGA
jgi:hypothetical protein